LPRTVLLDANALMMPFQFRINLEAELRRLLGDIDIAVPTPVLEELRMLATHDRDAMAASRLAAKYRAIEGHESADDTLLDLAMRLHAIVVTNDQPLLDRLKREGIPRAYLRSHSHLILDGL
jgi:rRNA-processing protein FCF1